MEHVQASEQYGERRTKEQTSKRGCSDLTTRSPTKDCLRSAETIDTTPRILSTRHDLVDRQHVTNGDLIRSRRPVGSISPLDHAESASQITLTSGNLFPAKRS